MSEFLFQYYPVHPTTWVYLSSLLMIGVYFKFSRFWSVRNVDLVLLILLAPGLLMVHFGEQRAWLEKSAAEGNAIGEQQAPAEIDFTDGGVSGSTNSSTRSIEPQPTPIAVTAELSGRVEGALAGDTAIATDTDQESFLGDEKVTTAENDAAAQVAASLSGK
ncbi:MAG TPA: hypothetical protein P5307_01390 [Pirellulaceae bacterium]|nr:hypothetical protein [Pirellulaceae bacterium]